MTKIQGHLVLSLLAAHLFASLFVNSAAATAAVPHWAYRIENVSDIGFNASMATLGAEGWELVFARRAGNGESGAALVMSYEMILRRQVR